MKKSAYFCIGKNERWGICFCRMYVCRVCSRVKVFAIKLIAHTDTVRRNTAQNVHWLSRVLSRQHTNGKRFSKINLIQRRIFPHCLDPTKSSELCNWFLYVSMWALQREKNTLWNLQRYLKLKVICILNAIVRYTWVFSLRIEKWPRVLNGDIVWKKNRIGSYCIII